MDLGEHIGRGRVPEAELWSVYTGESAGSNCQSIRTACLNSSTWTQNYRYKQHQQSGHSVALQVAEFLVQSLLNQSACSHLSSLEYRTEQLSCIARMIASRHG